MFASLKGKSSHANASKRERKYTKINKEHKQKAGQCNTDKMKRTVGVAKTNAKRPEKKQAKVFQKLENDQTERQENINENKKKE